MAQSIYGSLLSRLNPIPHFPDYTGPYKVGTVDVEIPVSELSSPCDAPDNAVDIETVQFRIFYPCEPTATGKKIPWLPAPQRDHLSAYIKFLGVGPLLAEAASFLPRHLYYTSIPVIKNAPILAPHTENNRWPTMLFSHGLGGSRNAYSQLVGSLASHGMVVICPEHRDGSAVASFVRLPSEQDRFFKRNTRRIIPYNRIPHDTTDEIHELRNDQLRIRLWELGLIHEAMLEIDEDRKITNLNKSTPSLDQFVSRLDVHEPGSIIFAGHSFGSATMVQFLKSVFYAGRPELETMDKPLYTPMWRSSICRQVTPQNKTILLDMWCFPLLAKSTKALFNLPLPVYAPVDSTASRPSPGGSSLLAVESQDFFKWREHLHATARVLSPNPAAQVITKPNDGTALPYFFYAQRSAHLSQSDFAILFPWVTAKVFKSESPERALRLNLRAILQFLRVNDVSVAGTKSDDMVDDVSIPSTPSSEGSAKGGLPTKPTICAQDTAILDRAGNTTPDDAMDGLVRAWRFIDIVGMGQPPDKLSKTGKGGAATRDAQDSGSLERGESDMADVIEPNASAAVADPTADDKKVPPTDRIAAKA